MESETGERRFFFSRLTRPTAPYSPHTPTRPTRLTRPHTPYGRARLARFARVGLLRHALPISLLILRKNRLFCSL